MSDEAEATTPRAAYVHVPFCRHRCGYCNFTLVAGRDDLIPAYLNALSSELSCLTSVVELDTLFLGGGTPSHLSIPQLEQLFGILRRHFALAESAEFSLEANPEDLDEAKIAALQRNGVTRLSLGIQSFRAERLAFLQRSHTPEQAQGVVTSSQAHGLEVAIDLIFGGPAESLEGWQADLTEALALDPVHLSTYGLTIERGTEFWSRQYHGTLGEADEDLELRLYQQAIDRLTASGFEHYEVSNFAKPGFRCRHNETYWLRRPYWAFGPGAARFLGNRRETNHRSVTTYIQRVQRGESPVAEYEVLDPRTAALETLVLGLRRLEGLVPDTYRQLTGFSLEELAGDTLRQFKSWGMLTWSDERIRLTREGLVVSDSLWTRLLGS